MKIEVNPKLWEMFDSTDEALVKAWKSFMLMQIIIAKGKLGLTQRELAAKLKVSQPRVSNLLTGQIHKFSLETLLKMNVIMGNTLNLTTP